MSKDIRVQSGNFSIDIDSGVVNTPSAPDGDAKLTVGGFGVIAETTGGTAGFEIDTWAAGDKGYVGVYNDETGQYSEFAAHGSTFGAGSLNSVFYTTTDVSPLDFLGDYKVMMQLESTSAANTFVNVTDGTILRIWDDTEVDNVAIQHDGTNLVFTPTTTDALALEGLYLNMLEIADPAFTADIGRGKLWVQNTVPNQLMFTDDAGNDIVAASLAATVNISGTPVDNQVTVWNGPNTIEGDANLTWTGTLLTVAGSVTMSGAGTQMLLPLEADPLTPTLAFGDADTGFYESADDTLSVSIGGSQRWNWAVSNFEGAAINGPALINTGASATQPTVVPIKSDTNTGIGSNSADQLSLIAGSIEMLRLVETGVAGTDQIIIAPAGIIGSETNPALAFGDGNTGFFENGDNVLAVTIEGAARHQFNGNFLRSNNSAGYGLLNEVASNINPVVLPNNGDADTGLGQNAIDQLSLIAGGVEMLRLVETGVATTDQVIIAPAGIIGTAATPALAFGDGDSGFYESGDDNIVVSLGTVATWDFNGSFFQGVAGGTPALAAVDSTATVPNILPWKGDTDTGLGQNAADELSLIAGAKEMLRLVETGTATTDQIIIAPAGVIGDTATPALAFGDGDSGFYESADDILWVTIAGGNKFRFQASTFIGNSSGAAYIQASAGSVGAPTYAINGDSDTGIYSTGADALSISTGAVEAKRFQAATVQTTTATQTEIIAIPVASGTTFGYRINIVGNEAATGDTVFESIFGAIHNQGGTTAIVGSDIVDRTEDAGAAAWVVTVAADDTTDALTVDVTGEASHTIDWKVSVEILDV